MMCDKFPGAQQGKEIVVRRGPAIISQSRILVADLRCAEPAVPASREREEETIVFFAGMLQRAQVALQ